MGRTIRVLLIEDDQFIRDVYTDLLTEGGYQVETANDGQAGLAKIEEAGFDLILLDIMMPKMNGLEVLKRLKEKPSAFPQGPIILLSNLSHDKIINEALAIGATSYLVKSSLNPDQFLSYIKKLLG